MGTITFEAQWKELPRIRFVCDKENWEGTICQPDLSVSEFIVEFPSDSPVKDYNKFTGWMCDIKEDIYEAGISTVFFSREELKDLGSDVITFTAQWEELPSVNVVYDRQDDSKNTTVPVKKKSEAEETFSISLPTDESVYEDYEFIGWKYKINDGEYSQGIYTVNDEAPVFKWADFANGGTITCEAQWIKLAEVTVNFMNGTEMVNDFTIQKATGIDSFQIYIPEVIPGKEGYVFTGWKSSLDEEKLYESGSEITGLLWSDYKEVGTITFEAQWEWDNESIFETATYPLVAGNRYYLTDGTWTVNDDGYSYTGDITFSVREDGDYTFKKN